MDKCLGWLTLAGLVSIAAGYGTGVAEMEYPLPITLLCLGAILSLGAGIVWAHMPGSRAWKVTFLGLVGYSAGAAVGVFAATAMVPASEKNLGTEILLAIAGWWVGGILFACLAVWWGIRFHRRYAAGGQ